MLVRLKHELLNPSATTPDPDTADLVIGARGTSTPISACKGRPSNLAQHAIRAYKNGLKLTKNVPKRFGYSGLR